MSRPRPSIIRDIFAFNCSLPSSFAFLFPQRKNPLRPLDQLFWVPRHINLHPLRSIIHPIYNQIFPQSLSFPFFAFSQPFFLLPHVCPSPHPSCNKSEFFWNTTLVVSPYQPRHPTTSTPTVHHLHHLPPPFTFSSSPLLPFHLSFLQLSHPPSLSTLLIATFLIAALLLVCLSVCLSILSVRLCVLELHRRSIGPLFLYLSRFLWAFVFFF